jgi:threonine dehydrogenase-like Zn-dependent dehydrogenase
MKAVVFRGVGKVEIEDVPDPRIADDTDAVVRITASAICGTDLHFVRGTVSDMREGTILGHEGVGIVEELGDNVRNLNIGDRVVIASTIACGTCSYCRSGYYSQCDQANPHGPGAGTAFFGGPKSTGPFHGLQAEKALVPFAHVGLVKLPDEVSDEQAIMLADIFPTGYFGAELAEIKQGDTVAVFGCGPVGQFAIASAALLGAGRILAVDMVPSRLDMARAQGAEVIDANEESPPDTIKRLTGGIGVDRAIDAVGIDSFRPSHGPAARAMEEKEEQFDRELEEAAPDADPDATEWQPGNAPSLAVTWAVESLAKAGTLAIIGVYPPGARFFPIGPAMNKNLTLQMGNCPHRKYIPRLIRLVQSGVVDPSRVLTQQGPLSGAVEAYKAFDKRQAGWIKVELEPAMSHAP